MSQSRRERYIHRQLKNMNVIPFDQWKQEGRSLSYFHKNIIDYDYVIRNYIHQTTCRYTDVFPLRIRHKGWPLRSPMTPQAWTVMETLAGLEYFDYTDETYPTTLYDALAFMSTCILQSEIHTLWDELLNTIYICTEQKAEVLCSICIAMIHGYCNRNPLSEPICMNSESSIMCAREFLTRTRKISLLRELYYNPKESFDTFIQWIYEDKEEPYLIRRLYSSRVASVEYIRLLSSEFQSRLPPCEVSSYHPRSPSEQSETSDSTSSQPSPSQESP